MRDALGSSAFSEEGAGDEDIEQLENAQNEIVPKDEVEVDDSSSALSCSCQTEQ